MKKKGFLLASSVGALFVPTVGQAADLQAPVLKAPPPVAPVESWTGFYIGGNGGVAWQRGTNSPLNHGYGTFVETNATSGTAGGQIGYNWQPSRNYVFGVEVDGSWVGRGGKHYPNETYTYASENGIRWLATARIRAGLVVGDTMAYVTGGVAFGGVKNCYACDFSSSNVKSESKTRVGWAIGGGVEHMITRNWTFGIEALFVDLGTSTVTAINTSKTTKFSNQAVIGRLKLNYKF